MGIPPPAQVLEAHEPTQHIHFFIPADPKNVTLQWTFKQRTLIYKTTSDMREWYFSSSWVCCICYGAIKDIQPLTAQHLTQSLTPDKAEH